MYKAHRLLLILLACFYSSAILAQVNVNVLITGIEQPLMENVRLFLSIEQEKNNTQMSESRLRRLHNKAVQEITNALQPFGYYRPVIKSELTLISPDHWQASYSIDPGPPLLVGEFDFIISEEMGKDSEFQKLIQNPPFHKGDVFSHLEYEKFKTNLANLAAERGYFNAHFIDHRVEIDLDAYEARIHLHYDGGARYHFGEVLLNQDVLNPKFLKRYIPFEKDSPYTLSQLIELQNALNNSDYFQTVEVTPDQAQLENTEVPITVTLTPRKPNRYTMGLGYGTDTGARAKFGWDKPRLNRDGHRLNTEVKVSEKGYSLSAHYIVPVFNPRTDQIVYSAGVVNEKTDASESTVRTIGASLNRGRDLWRESLALNYQKEIYTVADDSGFSTLLMPGANWSRTWGNNFISTLDGLRFNIGFRGASKKVLSDTDFFQLQGSIKGITSLGQHDRIIARGSLGGTWTEDFHQLPSSVRFFAGGSQSVRGYAYQSLGPVNSSGDVVGGRDLMVGSVEFEHSFKGKWGVALFYDAGNAIDDIADRLERGAGFGLRWRSPVGPIRFDLASAITQEGKPWRFHINIGPDL